MRVYIAGPYTKGDVVLNVRRAVEAADQVLKAGHAPYCPHLTHFWHYLCPGSWEQWLALDKEWVKVCEALIRLDGDSVGADREAALARSLGIPVFDSVESWTSYLVRRDAP